MLSLGLRLLVVAGLVSAATAICAADQLLPDRVGSYRKGASKAAPLSDPALFQELGSTKSDSATYGAAGRQQAITAYQVRDTTGALATWEWMRTADDRPCDLASYCAQNSERTLVWDANYVLAFSGAPANKTELSDLVSKLPDVRESSLPPVLSFIPHKDLVPNSARYILGPVSLSRAAPELAKLQPGFDSGAEAHCTSYNFGASVVRLALFYYPAPEMARLHTVDFKLVPGTSVKRSGVLVAVVLPGATQQQADSVLGQVEYEGKITWNETQQANPVSTLYRLLVNIMIMSLILVALCLAAGIIYAFMRLYRRRFGTLEQDEAMTTLHLTGD